MSYRILVEIGHEASIRTKRTPEGFTHDWEIFVRGCDADIHHYVEKVVFNLHETFAKPRRVVKEPPYKVKESGYAGFNLLIDLYLKNSDEPKKISFYYDLHLQQSGPAIFKSQKEKYVFHHPNEEFRQRLIKGGAMLVNAPSTHSESSRDYSASSEERSQLVDKPKLGGDMNKKPKMRVEEPKLSNSFADLFGPPITKSNKVSPEPKAQIKNSPKSISSKTEKNLIPEKVKSKHSPYKDKAEKIREKEHKKIKDEKRNKDKLKERERSKEKLEKSSKREKSPQQHRPSASPRRSPKRESSPKKISSSPRRISSPSSKPKLDERNKYEDNINKDKNETTKLDKKPKKDKRDKTKDKDKREHKSHSKDDNKNDLEQKEMKQIYKDSTKGNKEISKEKEQLKMKEKGKSTESSAREKEPDGKDKEKNINKHETSEKHKHKHKKKDREKSKKDEKERKHEKKNEKSSQEVIKHVTNNDSTKSVPIEIEKENSQIKNSNSTNTEMYSRDEKPIKEKSVNPLNTLITELTDNDSSDSSSNSISANIEHSRNKNIKPTPSVTIEREPIKYTQPEHHPVKELPPPPPPPPLSSQPSTTPQSDATTISDKKIVEERSEKTKKSKKHKDKHKQNKTSDKDSDRKRKRKSSARLDEVEIEKIDEPTVKQSKNTEEEKTGDIKEEMVSPASASSEYMCMLRDLQHKIMTLQDNSELQRVVQLIAETGQYEITRQTFDFDLCALDRGTVKRLQDFFTTT